MTNLPQSVTSNDTLPEKRLGRSPLWFKALGLLTVFTFGGWVATELTQGLLQRIADRLVTVEAQAEILNVLDHLLPYRIGYVAATFLLIWITVGAYLWLRTRSTLAISLLLAIPLVTLLYFWVLREPLVAPVGATSPTSTVVVNFPTATPAAMRAPTTTAVAEATPVPTAVTRAATPGSAFVSIND